MLTTYKVLEISPHLLGRRWRVIFSGFKVLTPEGPSCWHVLL